MRSSLRRLVGAVVLVAGLGLALPTSAQAADANAFALGDSVMLGAKWALQRQGITVDAKVSRQARVGAGLLKGRGQRLPHNVVIHLGTNGPMDLADCRAMVAQAGPSREVFLVTVHAKRRWVQGNNATIQRCAAGFPGRVHVVDWNWAASHHPGWLYADGIHLRPAGAKAFTRLVTEAIANANGQVDVERSS